MTEPQRPPSLVDRPSQTTAILLWVAIVAGVVFIVAVVFFSGFVIGRGAGAGMDWDRDGGTYRPMGPGMMGPWSPWSPNQQSSSSAVPSPSRP